jgi:dTDP-4-amino-4,6-dideoxygalactose transaminase
LAAKPVTVSRYTSAQEIEKTGFSPDGMIPFNDLRPIHQRYAEEIRAAVERVIESGWFILGPEVENFENRLAEHIGVAQAIGVANGTDAIELALRATGIGPGDEVLTVAHTAVATATAIERANATVRFADIDPSTYALSPEAAAAAITPNTKAIVVVHLYGHPANMTELVRLAQRHHLVLIEDCAQALGATWQGQSVGTFGHLGAFSFYPTKNLGACGDAGAVVTNDRSLAERLRRLRCYGQVHRDKFAERGINSRLDEIQAAILAIKLQHFRAEKEERRVLVDRYRQRLTGVDLPMEARAAEHAYHLFVVRHPDRDGLRAHLSSHQIQTLIHYPVPIHRQPAFEDLGYAEGSLPETETAAREIVSLPLYLGLSAANVDEVADAVAQYPAKVPL